MNAKGDSKILATHPGALSLPRALAFGAGACLVGSLATWLWLGRPAPGIDDAYITLVYGRNLAGGHGYVYTPGFERVEGSTSPLWTAVAALAAALSPRPEWLLLGAALVATSVAIAAFLLTVDRLTALRAPGKGAAALALALAWVLAQPDYFAWNVVTLMDSAAWSMGVACAVSLLSRDASLEQLPEGFGAPLALFLALAVARPESLALLPALLALAALALPRPWSARAVLRRYGPGVAAFAALQLALVLVRLWYFGWPLPNTYYVKAPESPLYALRKGLGYLAWFARARPWALVPLALSLASFARLSVVALRRRGLGSGEARGTLVVAGAVAVGLALPLPTGGDGFGAFRMLQPFVPFFALPAIPVLLASPRAESAWRRSTVTRVAAGALALLALVAIGRRFAGDNLLGGEFAAAREGQRAGALLERAAAAPAPETTVGVIAAGGVAWSYSGRVVDLLGLNWTRMAHSAGPREGARHGHAAFQPDVFWAEPPDILVLDMGTATKAVTREDELATAFALEVLKGVPAAPSFAAAYEPGCLVEGSEVVSAYFSRLWLARVHPASFSPLPCGPK